jgi:hypothetical protein
MGINRQLSDASRQPTAVIRRSISRCQNCQFPTRKFFQKIGHTSGEIMNRKTLALALICALAPLVASPKARCQTSGFGKPAVRPAAQGVVAPSDIEIDLLRKDLRSQKKQIIAANMKLTDKEAEKFWPLYDQYTAETIKINDKRYGLIQNYAQNYNQITDQQAEDYVRGLVAVDQASSQLRLTYWPKFRSAISAKNTALFFQLDRRITNLIDAQLASQIPVIEP